MTTPVNGTCAPGAGQQTASGVHVEHDDVLRGRGLTRALWHHRMSRYTLGEVAAKMGCDVSHVAVLERRLDDCWTVGELKAYARAIGYTLDVSVRRDDEQ